MSRTLQILLLVVLATPLLHTQTILQHPGTVYWGRFSPNGESVATACADGAGRIWSTDGTLLHTLAGHTLPPTGIEYSPDGMKVVTASFDSTARVWDVNTGALLLTLRGHGGRVRQAVFSPDGSMVATASLDGTARIWNAQTGDTMHVLTGHGAGVFDIAFSPDGRRIATASYDMTARIWDVSTGISTATLARHASRVIYVAYNHSGNRLVTTAFDPIAYIWDSTGALVDSIVHGDRVNTATFSMDDQRVLTSSFDTTARATTLDGSAPPVTFKGHTAPILSAEFGRNDTRVITSGFDNTARLYVIPAGDHIRTFTHNGRVPVAAISPTGETALTVGFDSVAKLWSLEDMDVPSDDRKGSLEIRMEGNGMGTIEYNVDRRGPVTLTIVDTQGVEIIRLPQGLRDPGSYNTSIDLSPLPSGVYLCSLRASERVTTRSLVVTR